jgi:integrase
MGVLVECLCHKKQSLRNKLCSCGEDLIKAKRANRVNYWIAYRLPGGKQRRELTGASIEEARDADGKRRVQKREHRIFDIKLEAKMTFKELTDWYLSLQSVKDKKYFWVLKIRLNQFNSIFGSMMVQDVKNSALRDYQAKRKKEGKALSTIDQEIGAAKTIINAAFYDDKVGGDVLKQFKTVGKLLRGNSNKRKRTLTPMEFNRLVGSAPVHLKPILWMGYDTGTREGEALNLKWKGVSLKDQIIKLEAYETKDAEAREIPISDELWGILSTIPRGIQGDYNVFTHRRKAIKDIRTGLTKACKGAGIVYGRFKDGGFIYHDLRRTFYTDARRAGVPDSVIRELTGHCRNQVTDRYDEVSMDDKRRAVEKIVQYRKALSANVDQTVDQVTILGS